MEGMAKITKQGLAGVIALLLILALAVLGGCAGQEEPKQEPASTEQTDTNETDSADTDTAQPEEGAENEESSEGEEGVDSNGEENAATFSTLVTPVLEGPITDSGMQPLSDGKQGSMPSFSFDYSYEWSVVNEVKDESYYSVSLEHPSGLTLSFFSKLGAAGGAMGTDYSYTTLADTQLSESIDVIRLHTDYGDYLRLHDAENRGSENVEYADGMINFSLSLDGEPLSFDPETDVTGDPYGLAVEIMSTLRLS